MSDKWIPVSERLHEGGDATSDAINEVIHCRDCKWWHKDDGGCYAKEAHGFGHMWEESDYCSYGERKDERFNQQTGSS